MLATRWRRRSADMLSAVPFVWLPDQRVDHAAGFATLRGAPSRRQDEGTNRWVLVRGRFSAPTGEAELRLLVDGRYRAWLNGRQLGRGPVRSSPRFARFDRYSLQLPEDHGLLALLVHVPGIDLAWYETVKGAWQPVFGDGAVYAELSVAGRIVEIDWKILESEAWTRDTPRSGWGQDFIEQFDARRLDPEWMAPDFDDGGWPLARAMISLGGEAEVARGFGRVEPFPSLLPSGLPAPVEEVKRPSRLLYARRVEPRPDLPLDSRLYREVWGADASDRIDDPDALLSDVAYATVKTLAGSDTGLMFEFDPYHAGYPFVELDAKGGEVVEIAVAEAVPGELGRGEIGDGLRLEGHLGVSHLFHYTARPGRQRFEKFNWTAVRAMQIVVRDAPDGIGVRVGSVATHYDAHPEGEFECSDPLLTRLWQVGRHTVLQCMHDAWVDCPGREARQWVGDGVVAFDVAALAFGPSIYPLHRQFLHQAAESQRPDGLVRMFAPGDIAADALAIPDFTLLWILSLERYHRQTADLETVDRLLPAVERALHWFERHSGKEGLLCDVPEWHFIEWAHIGRDGASAAINALHIGALKATAALADASGRPRLAASCLERAEQVTAAIGESHWDDRRGLYVDSVDPRTGTQAPRASQHANALLLLFDAMPRDRISSVVSAITDVSRLKLTAAPPIVPTGVLFDPERDIVRANSFYSHFVYDGLARGGRFDWVVEHIRMSYGPMLATDTTTLWESFSPNASLCHGFSATPVYQLSKNLLGVEPLDPGYRRFRLAPQCADLEWARGIIPTPAGPISVGWNARDGQLEANVTYPQECELELPDEWAGRLIFDKPAEGARVLRFTVP